MLTATEYVAPRNGTEEKLVAIWQEILGKDPIGIRDNFFDLGGDSIRILRMMAALRRELNLEVPIAEVYRHNTIESLLEHIASNQQEIGRQQTAEKEQEAMVRQELEALKERILATITEAGNDTDNIEDVYPMSDIEKGMVFEFLVSEGAGVYHDQMVHQRVFFDFDIERFRHAMELVVEKTFHPSHQFPPGRI